jgi:glycogen debranching enzyme
VRTVSAGQARYNPMSYHNGSVWPHDNAIAAAGLARYGRKDDALRILGGLFDASQAFDLHRLPELFCGFPRRPGESPTQYPVSCMPQAWAAGAVFMLLEACLGIDVRGSERRLVFDMPRLPRYLNRVEVNGLRVADAVVDLSLTRHGDDVGVHAVRREGDVEVVLQK